MESCLTRDSNPAPQRRAEQWKRTTSESNERSFGTRIAAPLAFEAPGGALDFGSRGAVMTPGCRPMRPKQPRKLGRECFLCQRECSF